MTVLVTGASGFLGRRVAEMVGAAGEKLRLLLRPSSDMRGLDAAQCGIVRCSFADVDGLTRAMRGVRIVYHCAGRSADWGDWADFRASNVDAVGNLLEAARRAGTVQRFVHVSTTDIYGYPATPVDESGGIVDTGLPYNRSKGLGDRLALDFHRRTGLPVTVVRPATIFGPRSKDWVIDLARHLAARRAPTVGGGKTAAGLVYVDDVVHAMTSLAAAPDAVGQAFNVVDPQPVTWRDYFDAIADAAGAPRTRFDLAPGVALALGGICEAAYRVIGMTARPLVTRHVVLLLSWNQQYDMKKLLRTVPAFPVVGVARGLEATATWLRARGEVTRHG